MPSDAIYVGRPSPWGNPFAPQPGTSIKQCIELFRQWAWKQILANPEWIKPLKGKDLACWCRPGDPCHADILLDLANEAPEQP